MYKVFDIKCLERHLKQSKSIADCKQIVLKKVGRNTVECRQYENFIFEAGVKPFQKL